MSRTFQTTQTLKAELDTPVLQPDGETNADSPSGAADRVCSKHRVWVISELYYPELTSTGYFLTGIAEGLAETCAVSVLCGQPSYWLRGVRAPTREERNGVQIRRCWATTFNKNKAAFKVVNMLTISTSILLNAIGRIRRNDTVIVVTNPPLLPYLVALACRAKRARLVLLVHDVYPEILVQLGLLKPKSVFIKAMNVVSSWLYRSSAQVLVIGRDMRDLIAKKLPPHGLGNITIAPNWADTRATFPKSRDDSNLLTSLGIDNKFVVQFWGNMGRPHCVEDIVQAAELLAAEPGIHFLLIGWGTRKPWVVAEQKRRSLVNMTILDPLPREQSCEVQNACDLAINTLSSGMTGISVPSRSYNAMAAAKPILAVCDADSELSRMVREEDIGWVIPPGRPDLLAAALREAAANRDRLRAMGQRARQVVEAKYTPASVIGIYQAVIEGLRAC
ncbi:MAG: glycosyltransferase family 4 protein [Terracidiphilus sp.]